MARDRDVAAFGERAQHYDQWHRLSAVIIQAVAATK
jgi:hypothetical protein